jgi:hypothetical protein
VHVGVDRHLLTDPEPVRSRADPVDHADQLVARDEREDRVEVALVDVQVGAAHADLVDLDAHLARTGLGRRHLRDGIAARGVVHDGLHSVSCAVGNSAVTGD